MRSTSRPKLFVAVIWALVAAALVPAAANANHFDEFADRGTLVFNQEPQTDGNDTAFADPLEVLTTKQHRCGSNGAVATDGTGRAMGGTLWWEFSGNNSPITVSTMGSNFDTVLGVWKDGFANGQLAGCNDDTADDVDHRFSEVRLTAASGSTYYVQVGGLCTAFGPLSNDDCTDWKTGVASVAAWTLPSNDTRAGAIPIHDHHAQTFETRGAREDGEGAPSCNGAPFGKTVWFRFDAPSKGTAHFNASGFDTVMSIYDGTAFAGCDDDPPTEIGSAHLPVEVQPGHSYFVQAGGYGGGRASDAGHLEMSVTFTQDTDWDDDGSAAKVYGGGDCDDNNRNIRPGIDDTPNNDVDENCDDYKDYDRDGDGYRVTVPQRNPLPTNWDCNDTPPIGARIHPGARDVRGNSLNEDCVGGAAKALGLPSQVTDFWKPTASGGARVDSMKVNPVLKRSRIKILCRGPGCPFAKKSILIRRRAKARVLTGLFRGRVFHTGAVLQVRVLPPSIEWIGRSETYRIRGTNVSATKGCFNFRGRKVKCPA